MKTARAVNHSLILQAFWRLPFLKRLCLRHIIASVRTPSDRPNRISGNCPESVLSPQPPAEGQLPAAGYRLARVLNELFG